MVLDTRLEDLTEALARGAITRRQFIRRALAAGLTLPAIADLLAAGDTAVAAGRFQRRVQQAGQDQQELPAEEDHHLRFFRHGEVLLLLRSNSDASLAPTVIDLDSLRGLGDTFSGMQIDLHRQNWFLEVSQRAEKQYGSDGSAEGTTEPGQPLLIQRDGYEPRVLQMVRLASWLSEDDRRRLEADDQYDVLADALEAVVEAVERLNAETPTIGGYTLVSASPNWLSMPFQCY